MLTVLRTDKREMLQSKAMSNWSFGLQAKRMQCPAGALWMFEAYTHTQNVVARVHFTIFKKYRTF